VIVYQHPLGIKYARATHVDSGYLSVVMAGFCGISAKAQAGRWFAAYLSLENTDVVQYH
jgi:hypothetical protein